jgi:hypothetical protein
MTLRARKVADRGPARVCLSWARAQRTTVLTAQVDANSHVRGDVHRKTIPRRAPGWARAIKFGRRVPVPGRCTLLSGVF